LIAWLSQLTAELKIFCSLDIMLIKVKVFPESDEDIVIEKSLDSFEVKVREKPIQGRANQEVKRLLAEHFKVEEERVRMIKGFKERNKVFEIKNI